jgi:hypothetical protein
VTAVTNVSAPRANAAKRASVRAPRATAVLFSDQIFLDGTSVTAETKRATVIPASPVVVSPAASPSIVPVSVPVASPGSNAVFFGSLVLSGESQAQKASQKDLLTPKMIKH